MRTQRIFKPSQHEAAQRGNGCMPRVSCPRKGTRGHIRWIDQDKMRQKREVGTANLLIFILNDACHGSIAELLRHVLHSTTRQ